MGSRFAGTSSRSTRFPITLIAAAVLFLAEAASADSSWVDHYRAAQSAHRAGDIARFRDHLLLVSGLIGDSPGVNYNLACAAARLGDTSEALRRLELYRMSGLVRDAEADSDFAALRPDPEFRRIAGLIRANGDSVGIARVHHRFQDASLLTEDLAFDPVDGSFFATSIHRGRVIEITSEGVERPIDIGGRPGWGVFAACVDVPHRLLWMTVAATPTTEGFVAADSGRSGLVAWNLRKNKVAKRIEWPRDGRDHRLGDLTVAGDGTVYVCDSRSGAVRKMAPDADSMTTVVPDGGFSSPQTPALSPDGRRLYVPEYGRGIAVIDLAASKRTWVTFAPGLALQGIDGLYAYGTELIAVQNGTRPARVMRLQLDETGDRVIGGTAIESGTKRLGEPTHGVIVGSRFYFLANTGWDRVGDDQRMKSGPADPPLILRAVLGGR